MGKQCVLMSALAAALVSVVGCTPDDGLANLAAGRAAYEAGDLRKAAKCLEQSHDAVATNVDTLVSLAQVKLAQGELAAAKSWIAKAEDLAASDSDVRLLAAQIAWHTKDYAAAAKVYSGLASDRSLDVSLRAEGLSGLGIVEMTCNNRELAQIAFLRALRLDRRHAAARYHLGLLYRDAFAYPEAALEQFNIYVRLDSQASPRVQKVQRSLVPELQDSISRAAASRPGVGKRDSAACAAALKVADEAWKKGNFKTARQKYQAAWAADSLSYPAALGLAQAWQKTDSSKAGLAKALDAYKQACQLRPTAVATSLATGALCTRLGQHLQAVEIYSRAVAANPTSIEALDGLIAALRRLGTKEKARVAAAYQSYREEIRPIKK